MLDVARMTVGWGAIWLWQVKHEENRRCVKALPREFETSAASRLNPRVADLSRGELVNDLAPRSFSENKIRDSTAVVTFVARLFSRAKRDSPSSGGGCYGGRICLFLSSVFFDHPHHFAPAHAGLLNHQIHFSAHVSRSLAASAASSSRAPCIKS